MKEKLVRFLSIFGIISLFVVGVSAANSSDDCTLYKGQSSVETDAVGVSDKADWKATGYADSTYGTYVYVYAAWTGWPYSAEYMGSVFANKKLEYTVTQSKDSVFYIALKAMNRSNQSHSYAYIKAR